MTKFWNSNSVSTGTDMAWDENKHRLLMEGEILVETQGHTRNGGAVQASMYVPLMRSNVWQQLTDYPRWVQYFPDVTKSVVLHRGDVKRLYQAAQKAFLFFTAKVEIYLDVVEDLGQRIHFRLEKGSFEDFSADINLQDCGDGTLLTYAVKATPDIPIPSLIIQQAMNFELPANMRKMRQVLCKGQLK